MSILYHGAFNTYSPEPDENRPSTMIPGVRHSRNDAGLDFYQLRDSIPESSLVVLLKPGETHVYAASKGPLMAFPTEGQQLYEIPNPPAELNPDQVPGMIINLATGELSPPITAPAKVITAKADLFRRVSDEQAEQMVTMLAAQTVRIQEIFKAAGYIDHADELFGLLSSGLTSLFGEEEATRILAPSL